MLTRSPLARVPLVAGALLAAACSRSPRAAVDVIRTRHAGENRLIVMCDPAIPYRILLGVIRTAQPLFPDVALAAGIQ